MTTIRVANMNVKMIRRVLYLYDEFVYFTHRHVNLNLVSRRLEYYVMTTYVHRFIHQIQYCIKGDFCSTDKITLLP